MSSDLGLAPACRALSSLTMLSMFWLGEGPLACASLEAQRRVQRRQLLIRSEIQGVKQLVLGQEVMEGYALFAKGTGPGLGSMGCKPFPSPGGHQDMSVCKPAAEGGCKPGSSIPLLLPLWDRGPKHGAAGGESMRCTHCFDLHSAGQWGVNPTSHWSALSHSCRGRAS